jgi:hypothetical protein
MVAPALEYWSSNSPMMLPEWGPLERNGLVSDVRYRDSEFSADSNDEPRRTCKPPCTLHALCKAVTGMQEAVALQLIGNLQSWESVCSSACQACQQIAEIAERRATRSLSRLAKGA